MIITAAEFAEARADISKGWEKQQDKIERCIQEAEDVDLYDVLGAFYFDVVENHDSAAYADLMNGATFTDLDGDKCKHFGLKKYIAGLAYVRYLGLSSAVHTPFGYVNKLSSDSEPVSYAAIKDHKKDLQRTLEVEFIRVNKYLLKNAESFATYSTGNNSSISYNTVRTSTLR